MKIETLVIIENKLIAYSSLVIRSLRIELINLSGLLNESLNVYQLNLNPDLNKFFKRFFFCVGKHFAVCGHFGLDF
jgi:hypothetical protein